MQSPFHPTHRPNLPKSTHMHSTSPPGEKSAKKARDLHEKRDHKPKTPYDTRFAGLSDFDHINSAEHAAAVSGKARSTNSRGGAHMH